MVAMLFINGLLHFHGLFILPVLVVHFVYHVYCFGTFPFKKNKNWSQAVFPFNNHQGTHKSQPEKKFDGLHTDTQDCMNKLMSEFNDVTQPINVMLDIKVKSCIEENREKLSPIVDTIKLCGHVGLSLRGHIAVGSYSSGQVGTFIELLNFRVRSGDTKLEEYLKNSAKNA